MAGIGQRFTSADHSVPWNAQTQYTMGRAVIPDCGKPVTTYGSTFNKRPLFGSVNSGTTGAPSFSDIATLSASGFGSRPGSSQRNGEFLNSLSSGMQLRTGYPPTPDSTIENGPPFFNSLNYNGGQTGSQRNFSDASMFPSLPSVNRVNANDLNNNRVTLGNTAPSAAINAAMAFASNRSSSNLFSSALTGDGNSSNLPPTRGVTLDPSEFPPILTSASRSGNSSSSTTFNSSSSQPPLRNYVSVMSKGTSSADSTSSQTNHQYSHTAGNQTAPMGFSKQDFPALPGTNQASTASSSTTSNPLTVNSTSNSHRPLPTNTSQPSNTETSSSTVRRQFGYSSNHLGSTPTTSGTSSFPSAVKHTTQLNGIQLLPNHLVTNIPKNMICDQFGMLGLLKLIQVGDYDATLNMLAPGLDLSSLHSNWQNPGELHSTFVSPCHDSCIGRPQDMDYCVPPEYLIRHLIADRLPDPPMDQLSEETLFWLFYNCCKEEAQLVVATELYRREWRFHKKEQIWLTRIMGANITKDNTSEQGDYYFWDPLKAQKSTHPMTILYSDLDNTPAAFRLSSGTLSAYVNVGLPNSSHHTNSHGSISQTSQQQHQLTAYQHQQNYSHSHPPLSSGSSYNPLMPHTSGSLSSGPSSLASLFNARQQQQAQKPQASPNPTYFPCSQTHGRSNQIASLFASRPTSTAPSSAVTSASSSGNATTTPLVETITGPTSALSLASTAASAVSENGVSQQIFESF